VTSGRLALEYFVKLPVDLVALMQKNLAVRAGHFFLPGFGGAHKALYQPKTYTPHLTCNR
jgi:hypothetical protein